MTTSRHRRNKREQASDVLRALLKTQDAKAAKDKAIWEQDQADAEQTRRALVTLGMERLPGLDVVGPPAQPLDSSATGDDDLTTPQNYTLVAGGKCGSCGGLLPWHYESCTISPKKVTP